jgi:hypothetical protein
MSDNNNAQSGGMGLASVLFIVFVVMRLTDNIDWAWYWVASPLWMPLAIALGVAAVYLAGLGVVAMIAWPFAKLKERRLSKAWRERNGVPKL